MAERSPSSTPGVPVVAVLLSWFIPGAGHLYLGRIATAAIFFLVVEGLYFAGLHFSGGMSFEYLDPELRTKLAPILSPEAGNLGGYLFQMQRYGFGPGTPRPFPDMMGIGTLLTALSGILNVFVMVHAHVSTRMACDALPKAKRGAAAAPTAAGFLTWLVPGLGHILQGRRVRGLIVFVLLVGLFVLGTTLAEGSNLSRERHFYYWSGQFMLGLPAILAEHLMPRVLVDHEIRYADAGLVFGCVAGLLNILAILDAHGYSEDRLLSKSTAGDPNPAGEPSSHDSESPATGPPEAAPDSDPMAVGEVTP